jgi:hypothetical protein
LPASWETFYETWNGCAVALDFTCPKLSESSVANFINNVAIKSDWILQGYDGDIPFLWTKNSKNGAEDLGLDTTGNNLSNDSLPSPSWHLIAGANAILKPINR